MLGYICDAGYISDGGYMGSAPCPQVRRWRYSGGCPNPTKDASYLGSQPQAPNISDGVYLGECPSPRVFMGSAPCPQCQTLPLFGVPNPTRRRKLFGEPTPKDRTLPLFGRMPEPQSEGRKLFGEPTPSPQYLRWHVFGRYPSPRVFMGSAPCPQVQTLPLFVEPEPNERTQAIWGAYPKPPISPMACIWELPKPQGVYGERPIPPISDAAAIRGVRTQREDASCLGSQPQAPNISDGVYLGVAQAPGCIWGVPHAPKTGRCRYSGSRTQFFIFQF